MVVAATTLPLFSSRAAACCWLRCFILLHYGMTGNRADDHSAFASAALIINYYAHTGTTTPAARHPGGVVVPHTPRAHWKRSSSEQQRRNNDGGRHDEAEAQVVLTR